MTDIHAILKHNWGYDSFRPLQREIIESLLSGRDTLGLMPTGGGKSLTFQVPALAMEGFCIVVTPLISLMKDQVDNLKRRGIKAASLHSGMSVRERRIAEEKIVNGGIKILYVSPERLRNEKFIQILRIAKVSFLVVDEAHCISQWGYDFRPAYLNIVKLRESFPDLAVLALTATATPEVVKDICSQLKMKDNAIFQMSFARPNVNYIVRSTDAKVFETFHILSRTSGSSIVYVRSRKRTREIHEYLEAAGISSTFYHAGLDNEVKEKRQNEWKRGEVRVMVATNAFGMGIDKPDVRVVIHCDLPPSLEEYYQEAGRAGRDGKLSWAVLLTTESDKALMKRRVTESFPPRDDIKKLYEKICIFLKIAEGDGFDSLYEFDLEKFCEIFKIQRKRCLVSLHLLSQAGYMEYIEETERRSRVIVQVTREELYHVGKSSDGAEKVMKALLREYTGLFSDYVFISESKLSYITAMSETEVYKSLVELSKKKIIHYVPRSRTPYIYLPTSREDRSFLLIGKNIYEKRKEILERRSGAMIQYGFSTDKCREEMMLRYFGQTSTEACGKCDVCREKRKVGRKQELSELDRICLYLKSKENGIDLRILDRDLQINGNRLRKYVSFLSGENLIRIDGSFLFWVGKR